MKRIFLILILGLTLNSCKKTGTDEASLFQEVPVIEEGKAVTYEIINEQIIKPFNCTVCHSAWAGSEAGLATKIVPGEPFSAKLYLRIEDGSMPMGGPAVDKNKLELLEKYIRGLSPKPVVVNPPPVVVTPPPVEEEEIVTYETIKKEIIEPFNCIRCHSAWAGSEAGLATRLIPGDPFSSVLFIKIENGSMPLGGPVVGKNKVALLEEYIRGLKP